MTGVTDVSREVFNLLGIQTKCRVSKNRLPLCHLFVNGLCFPTRVSSRSLEKIKRFWRVRRYFGESLNFLEYFLLSAVLGRLCPVEERWVADDGLQPHHVRGPCASKATHTRPVAPSPGCLRSLEIEVVRCDRWIRGNPPSAFEKSMVWTSYPKMWVGQCIGLMTDGLNNPFISLFLALHALTLSPLPHSTVAGQAARGDTVAELFQLHGKCLNHSMPQLRR